MAAAETCPTMLVVTASSVRGNTRIALLCANEVGHRTVLLHDDLKNPKRTRYRAIAAAEVVHSGPAVGDSDKVREAAAYLRRAVPHFTVMGRRAWTYEDMASRAHQMYVCASWDIPPASRLPNYIYATNSTGWGIATFLAHVVPAVAGHESTVCYLPVYIIGSRRDAWYQLRLSGTLNAHYLTWEQLDELPPMPGDLQQYASQTHADGYPNAVLPLAARTPPTYAIVTSGDERGSITPTTLKLVLQRLLRSK
jgi:hypothetical protein